MKKAIVLCLAVMAFAGIANAQQLCSTMGQKNPHGMAMKVSSVSVVDTANFMVSTVVPMPFTMGATDTIWFDVCMKAHDGMKHSTQIRYMTDMGMISNNISMTAPTAECAVVQMMNPHPMDMNIKSVWVDDVADFSVSSDIAMPFKVKNGGMIAFNLCPKVNDGKSHTAIVSYSTDMGTFSMAAKTIQAPSADVAPTTSASVKIAYPNPASNAITIQGAKEGTTAELFNANGVRVASSTISGNSSSISVASLPSGSYMLRVRDAGNVVRTQSISVQH